MHFHTPPNIFKTSQRPLCQGISRSTHSAKSLREDLLGFYSFRLQGTEEELHLENFLASRKLGKQGKGQNTIFLSHILISACREFMLEGIGTHAAQADMLSSGRTLKLDLCQTCRSVPSIRKDSRSHRHGSSSVCIENKGKCHLVCLLPFKPWELWWGACRLTLLSASLALSLRLAG